jgi:hypothetical protein
MADPIYAAVLAFRSPAGAGSASKPRNDHPSAHGHNSGIWPCSATNRREGKAWRVKERRPSQQSRSEEPDSSGLCSMPAR